MSNYNYLLCHYHKVDSVLWLEVQNWLRQVLIARVEQGTDHPSVYLSREMWNDLDEFILQMETAYIHPRRDSFHVKSCAITYSGFSVPSNHVSRRNLLSNSLSAQICTAHPCTNKNLKPYRKEVTA